MNTITITSDKFIADYLSPDVAASFLDEHAESLLSFEDDVLVQIIESLPLLNRLPIWNCVPIERQVLLLPKLQSDTARHLIGQLNSSVHALLLDRANYEQFLQISEIFPQESVQTYIASQSQEDIGLYSQVTDYADDTAGRYMSRHFIKCKRKSTLANIKDQLSANPDIVAVLITDNGNELLGHIPLSQIWKDSSSSYAGQLLEPITNFLASDTLQQCSRYINPSEKNLWFPVLDANSIAGVISANTVIWGVQEQISKAATKSAPTGEEDLFSPLTHAAKRRAVWLMINLLTAFLASGVVSIFEDVVQQVVVLAILMPVVASMGGIAGSQTLAVAVRGLALNHLSQANLKLVILKEMKIALINGIGLGIFIAIVCALWFNMPSIGLIIFVAILLNSLAAAFSGTAIPFILTKFKIDPAIAGSVILTTVTDVVGFMVFLGLGTIVYLMI